MRHRATIAFVLAGLLLVLGCNTRLEETDGGGVLLSISDFDLLPSVQSVNSLRGSIGGAGDGATISSITVQSIVRDIEGNTSPLMTVEMQSYEVTFTRADNGTRVPPPLVEKIFGNIGPGSAFTYVDLPYLRADQIENPPLSDLFAENGGFDKQTGRTSITLNVSIRFFGRSIAGEAVDTAPARFTVEFVP